MSREVERYAKKDCSQEDLAYCDYSPFSKEEDLACGEHAVKDQEDDLACGECAVKDQEEIYLTKKGANHLIMAEPARQGLGKAKTSRTECRTTVTICWATISICKICWNIACV